MKNNSKTIFTLGAGTASDALGAELHAVTRVVGMLEGMPADAALRVLAHARCVVEDTCGARGNAEIGEMLDRYIAQATAIFTPSVSEPG